MNSLVVVAVPDENDRVWKISSEKVPHLTILYLGEDVDQVQNVNSIVEFVEHAANTSLKRFSLTIDRRGELGADQADVIFFKKTRYDFKAIREFRAALLQDHNIRKAYDAASQFEGPWNPHLTLGYPASPAKPDPDNWGLYSVEFTKIQVWVGDYEGPEFMLKDWFDELDALDRVPMDVAMSDIQHHGVKGQRWGVRRDRKGRERLSPEGHSLKSDVAKAAFLPPALAAPSVIRLGSRAKASTKAYLEKRKTPEEVEKRAKRRLARRDFYWESHTYSDISHADIHNKVADEIDSKVYQLQVAPKYRGKNLKADKKLQDEYDQDVAKVTDAAYRRAVKDTYGTNPSGTKKAHYVNDVRGPRIEIRDLASGKTLREKELHPVQKDIEDVLGHSALSEDTSPEIMITVKTDDAGFITEIGRVQIPEDEEDSMKQTAELGEEFLAHYGVKGMRWGVRKASEAHFAFKANSARNIGRLTSTAAKKTRDQDLPAINAKYAGKGAKTSDKVHLHNLSKIPVQRQYRNEVREAYRKRLDEVANSTTNRAGTRRYEIVESNFAPAGTATRWTVKSRAIQHAADDDVLEQFEIEPIFDADGFITDFKFHEDSIAQSIDFGEVHLSDILDDEALAHYGVLGMKWGHRRSETPVAVTPTVTSRVPHGTKRKTKLSVEGGENHPAHEDAIKVAEARAKLRKSGTAALSNKELRDVKNRMELENQVKQLNVRGGRKFVTKLLRNQGEQSANRVISRQALARGF